VVGLRLKHPGVLIEGYAILGLGIALKSVVGLRRRNGYDDLPLIPGWLGIALKSVVGLRPEEPSAVPIARRRCLGIALKSVVGLRLRGAVWGKADKAAGSE